MAGVPKCCLVAHLKKLRKFNRQVFKQSQFVNAQELTFSIKVKCQEQSKSTKPRTIQRENKLKSQEKKKMLYQMLYDSLNQTGRNFYNDGTIQMQLVNEQFNNMHYDLWYLLPDAYSLHLKKI